ncbi:hypothetical protein ACQKOC_22155 [Enterobacter mori]|uniref:hypothetical protein n=1 Tax=Enterobacter mori TaxID=539813 RepID=UPI003CFC8B44
MLKNMIFIHAENVDSLTVSNCDLASNTKIGTFNNSKVAIQDMNVSTPATPYEVNNCDLVAQNNKHSVASGFLRSKTFVALCKAMYESKQQK